LQVVVVLAMFVMRKTSIYKWTFIWDITLIAVFIILRVLLLIMLCFLRIMLPFVIFALRLTKWTLQGMLALKRWFVRIRKSFASRNSILLKERIEQIEQERLQLLYARDDDGFTCLHIAASHPDVTGVIQLIESGGPELLYAKDNNGYSALHVAASHGHTDSVIALIDFGSDVLLNDKSYNGETALHLAASSGQTETALFLINRGGMDLLMSQENDGWTCLHRHFPVAQISNPFNQVASCFCAFYHHIIRFNHDTPFLNLPRHTSPHTPPPLFTPPFTCPLARIAALAGTGTRSLP
jgi:hypothetical protein